MENLKRGARENILYTQDNKALAKIVILVQGRTAEKHRLEVFPAPSHKTCTFQAKRKGTEQIDKTQTNKPEKTDTK